VLAFVCLYVCATDYTHNNVVLVKLYFWAQNNTRNSVLGNPSVLEL